MKQSVVVIGGGINGLVAANYLQRKGFAVTLLERKPEVGGACAVESYCADGRQYDYPSGATVLGFMQDYVYEDTGLSGRLTTFTPQHPAVAWFESLEEPCLMYDDIESLTRELKQQWGEEGNVAGFYEDLARVREFLISGYRSATVPTIEQALERLGEKITRLWISGSARNLLDHYFSSDRMKVFCGLDVTESGPVSIDSPYSAFTIPLMGSGSVFGGKWGFVKGGLWRLTEQLGELNKEIGVDVVTSAQVTGVSRKNLSVTYLKDGTQKTVQADHLIFATDPVSAAKILDDQQLVSEVNTRKYLGTSGKLVVLLEKPVVWRNDTGVQDFDSAFKFVFACDTLDQLESQTQSVVDGNKDFVPGYFEFYCEGAGMRRMGLDRGYESVTIFFKNLAYSKKGEDLPEVKKAVESTIFKYIKNSEDLIGTVLLTPKDLNERFFFPEGNIDHAELAERQTFFARNFSPHPEKNFYQFGSDERISLCAAGSYPCGSIAGTAGYMCASSAQFSQCFEAPLLHRGRP